MIEELKTYFATTPKQKIEADWKETEEFEGVGLRVDEYLDFNLGNYCIMVPTERLVEILCAFDAKYQSISSELLEMKREAKSSDKKIQEWREMFEARGRLENAIELLLPLLR